MYERLIDHTDDPGTIDTLQFLMTREITHMKAFQAALDSMEKKPFQLAGYCQPRGSWMSISMDLQGTAMRAIRICVGRGASRSDWNQWSRK